MILAHQGKGTMAGAVLDSAGQEARIRLGEYVCTMKHEYSWRYARRSEGETPRYGGMIIMVSPDEYVVAGRGVVVTFAAGSEDGARAGIGTLEEGRLMDGRWIAGRRMNGDQSHQGRHLHLPGHTYGIQKVRLYRYK
jgi:hypothetical protein